MTVISRFIIVSKVHPKEAPKIDATEHYGKAGSRKYGNSQVREIIERRIVECRRSRRIVSIAGRNEDNHTLSRPREENSVSVAQIIAVVGVCDVAPAISAKIVIAPVGAGG